MGKHTSTARKSPFKSDIFTLKLIDLDLKLKEATTFSNSNSFRID